MKNTTDILGKLPSFSFIKGKSFQEVASQLAAKPASKIKDEFVASFYLSAHTANITEVMLKDGKDFGEALETALRMAWKKLMEANLLEKLQSCGEAQERKQLLDDQSLSILEIYWEYSRALKILRHRSREADHMALEIKQGTITFPARQEAITFLRGDERYLIIR